MNSEISESIHQSRCVDLLSQPYLFGRSTAISLGKSRPHITKLIQQAILPCFFSQYFFVFLLTSRSLCELKACSCWRLFWKAYAPLACHTRPVFIHQWPNKGGLWPAASHTRACTQRAHTNRGSWACVTCSRWVGVISHEWSWWWPCRWAAQEGF